MMQVRILEAETDFSKLIRLLETKREGCITAARNGKPVVKITLINEPPVSKRIGVGKGRDMEAASSSAVLLEDAAYMHDYVCQHLTLTD